MTHAIAQIMLVMLGKYFFCNNIDIHKDFDIFVQLHGDMKELSSELFAQSNTKCEIR